MDMNDGGPAFPSDEKGFNYDGQYVVNAHPGMTLRDYFAAKALQGFLANNNASGTPESNATAAYTFADAMLKARDYK